MIIHCLGQTIEYDAPVTVEQVLRDVSPFALSWALIATVDATPVDLTYMLAQDATVEPLGWQSPLARAAYNRTLAHIMAQAVKTLFPTVKLACAPCDENGFCYDFEFVTQPSRGVLPRIEEEMRHIIEADLPYRKVEMTRGKALKLMSGFGEVYKMELVGNLPKGVKAVVYYQGDFADVTLGPMLTSTGNVGCFSLMSMSTAYWQNNKNNVKLRRVYGVGFADAAEQAAYLASLKEAKGTAKGALLRPAGRTKKVAKNS